MARLRHLDEQDLPEEQRHLLARPIAIHRVAANLPEVLRGVVGVGDWVRWHSNMDARLRELAIVEVGLLTGSIYEYAHHVKIALDFDVPAEDLKDLRRLAEGEPTGFGETELAVLRAVSELTLETVLSDDAWAALMGHLGEQQASELVATIAYYGMIVRLIEAFAVELEPEYETYLEQYPMPTTVAHMERAT